MKFRAFVHFISIFNENLYLRASREVWVVHFEFIEQWILYNSKATAFNANCMELSIGQLYILQCWVSLFRFVVLMRKYGIQIYLNRHLLHIFNSRYNNQYEITSMNEGDDYFTRKWSMWVITGCVAVSVNVRLDSSSVLWRHGCSHIKDVY